MVNLRKSTEEIIKEFKQGHDREANFKLLFERYYDQLYRFFQRKRMSAEDSRDLSQEVFISVLKGIEGLRDESRFQNWLFKIARNIYKNELERRKAEKRNAKEVSLGEERHAANERLTVAEQIADVEASPMEALLEKESKRKLSEAIQKLPPQMRRCVQLRVVKGLSQAEIAAIMGISVNTVKAHLHQARKLLREKLDQHFTGMKL